MAESSAARAIRLFAGMTILAAFIGWADKYWLITALFLAWIALQPAPEHPARQARPHPAPSDAAALDNIILGVPPGASRAEILEAYRYKARRWHPDAGGSTVAMTKLNTARDNALRRLADG